MQKQIQEKKTCINNHIINHHNTSSSSSCHHHDQWAAIDQVSVVVRDKVKNNKHDIATKIRMRIYGYG
jgi:hypothetical protein